MKKLLILGSLALAVLTGVALGSGERKRNEIALAEIRQEVAALRAENSGAARDWPRLALLADRPQAPTSPLETAPLKESAPAPPAPTAEKPPPLEPAEVRERYQDAFLAEPRDPIWAETARRTTNDRLPAYMPEGSVVRSLECRTSMCRLDVQHKDRDQYWRFMKAAFMDSNGQFWSGAVYATPLSEDPHDGGMVVFMAREEHTLPDLSP